MVSSKLPSHAGEPAPIPVYELRCRDMTNYFERVADVYTTVTHIRVLPDDAVALHHQIIARELAAPYEAAGLILLNQARRIVGLTTIATGDRQQVHVSTDAIVTRASLRCDCTSFIVFHNHLHGSVEPSAYDVAALARLLDELPPYFELVDFIITSGPQLFSFRAKNLFPERRAA